MKEYQQNFDVFIQQKPKPRIQMYHSTAYSNVPDNYLTNIFYLHYLRRYSEERRLTLLSKSLYFAEKLENVPKTSEHYSGTSIIPLHLLAAFLYSPLYIRILDVLEEMGVVHSISFGTSRVLYRGLVKCFCLFY